MQPYIRHGYSYSWRSIYVMRERQLENEKKIALTQLGRSSEMVVAPMRRMAVAISACRTKFEETHRSAGCYRVMRYARHIYALLACISLAGLETIAGAMYTPEAISSDSNDNEEALRRSNGGDRHAMVNWRRKLVTYFQTCVPRQPGHPHPGRTVVLCQHRRLWRPGTGP